MNDVQSIYPAALVMAGLTLIFSFPFRPNAVSIGAATTEVRWSTLEGLRGFLALGVYLHHAAFFYTYAKTGSWSVKSDFYFLCGELGVVYFFLITAFLFYGKILDERSALQWKNLYVGRLFRIAPLYLCVIAVLFALVFVRSGGEWRESPGRVAMEVVTWLGLGALGEPDINGQSAHLMTAGVTWTLRYEWLFYLALPAVAAATTRFGAWAPPILLLLASAVFGPAHHSMLLAGYFGGGMLVAVAVRRFGKFDGDRPWLSAVAVILLVMFFRCFANIDGPLQMLLIVLVFFLVCTGTTLFGLLDSLGARRLGRLSYGLYLWHGILLTFLMSIPVIRNLALSSETRYWTAIAACSLVLTGLSSLTYRWIEQVGIGWGRALLSGTTLAPYRAARG